MIETIKQAGIVGCGGAGFPTHAKLNGAIEHLILNGAECEPLLRTDRYVMRHYANDIVTAAEAVRISIGAKKCTIALKSSYKTELAALRAALQQTQIELFELKSFYPAGDEQTLVAEVTGQCVPPAGIPLDVGCVVSNVTTIYCVAQALQGKPFTHKFLTVAGDVKHPTVIQVPIGTSFAECLALAGGALSEDWMAVSGGPMMGKRLTKEQALQEVVTKTTSGILIFPADNAIARRETLSLNQMYQRARSVCIQCRRCTDLCPRHLLGHPLEPHRIMRQLAFQMGSGNPAESTVLKSAALCCECGVCELYACPMGLAPRAMTHMLKGQLAQHRVRWEKGNGQTAPQPSRKQRQVPTHSAVLRADVAQWEQSCDTQNCLTFVPQQVVLPLCQHIGAPCIPVVQSGDMVQEGQLIAKAGEGLSTNLHASICGQVSVMQDAIMIRKGAQA